MYIILDKANKLKWAGVLQKLIPSLPQEERNLALLLLENMKAKFGNFTQKQDSLPGKLTIPSLPFLPLTLLPFSYFLSYYFFSWALYGSDNVDSAVDLNYTV